MATLKRKDRSPYWHGIYKLANGKFRSRSTKTTQKREARRIVNEWEVEEQKIREGKSDQAREVREFIDKFPVSRLHTLIVPKRSVEDYFGLSDQERNDIHDLIVSQSNLIKEEDPEVEGFNIGWNCGEVAGQTVFHAHVHLIPRRKGDVENPRGGVRYVFPEKANY